MTLLRISQLSEITPIKVVFSDAIEKSANFETIRDIIQSAINKYPILNNLISKIDSNSEAENENADGFCQLYSKQRLFSAKLQYSIYFIERFLNSSKTTKTELKSILWHEIGHVLSLCVYKKNIHFLSYNNRNELVANPLGMAYMLFFDELKYRCKILNHFWADEKLKYSFDYFEAFEKCLSLHLTAQNSSELLAECYKYAYVGNEFYQGEEDFASLHMLKLSRSVVNDFKILYIE